MIEYDRDGFSHISRVERGSGGGGRWRVFIPNSLMAFENFALILTKASLITDFKVLFLINKDVKHLTPIGTPLQEVR